MSFIKVKALAGVLAMLCAYGAQAQSFTGTAAANQVYAGSTSGGAVKPKFRSLVGADLPTPGASSLGGVQSLTCSSHNWFSTLSTLGVFGCSQPNFSDLLGNIASSQLPPPGPSSLGAVNSKDCSSGSQFVQKINTDGSITCSTPAGGGNVSNSGTPTNGQLAQWISSTQIQGITPSAVGSSKVLLQCQSASNSASMIFNSTVVTSSFDSYEVEINSLLPVTNAVTLLLTISDDNGATYKSSGYQWARQLFYAGSATISGAVNASDSSIHVIDGVTDNNVGRPISGRVTFFAPAAAASRLVGFKADVWGISSNLTGTFIFNQMTTGIYGSALAGILNNIKFTFSSGNISLGNFCLYGTRNS
jgi:hypothetical protein